MIIKVVASTGSGPTELSAFDSALNAAGIANYNLIRLSSVIPPKSKLEEVEYVDKLPGKWGDRLYVVMAEQRAKTPNEEAWAGVGWVQDKKTGQGLFVEHEGKSEHRVRSDITQSLNALMATRNIDYGPIQMKVVGKTCTHSPVCAMVVAVYQASDWNNKAYLVGE